jgi:hypothetical protein
MTARKKSSGAKRVSKHPPYALKVKVEGPSVHKKSIPIPELIKLCSAIQTAVHRQAEAMEKPTAKTLRRGPITANAQEECTLELVDIVSGSTGLLFRYAKPQQHLPIPGTETFGSSVLAKVADTLKGFGGKKECNVDVDPGVLASLKELGETLEPKKITRISLNVPISEGKKGEIKAVVTTTVRDRIFRQMKAPTQERITVEGKLEMADFKETGRVCRIHPTIGLPVQCTFEPAIEDRIYGALRRPARITGLAKLNPNTRKVEELQIEEIEILDELLLGAKDFFASRTIEQLAEIQGVHPIEKPADLSGAWPQDENIDDFIDVTYRSRS